METISTTEGKRQLRPRSGRCHAARPFAWCVVAVLLVCNLVSAQSSKTQEQFELNDSHFHLTNYIQQGIDINDFLKIMGTKVGRVALFGIPLQQEWSYQNSGDFESVDPNVVGPLDGYALLQGEGLDRIGYGQRGCKCEENGVSERSHWDCGLRIVDCGLRLSFAVLPIRVNIERSSFDS